jgi:hypothetical protein
MSTADSDVLTQAQDDNDNHSAVSSSSSSSSSLSSIDLAEIEKHFRAEIATLTERLDQSTVALTALVRENDDLRQQLQYVTAAGVDSTQDSASQVSSYSRQSSCNASPRAGSVIMRKPIAQTDLGGGSSSDISTSAAGAAGAAASAAPGADRAPVARRRARQHHHQSSRSQSPSPIDSERWVARFIADASMFRVKCVVLLSYSCKTRYIPLTAELNVPLESHVVARFIWCSDQPFALIKQLGGVLLELSFQFHAQLVDAAKSAKRARQTLCVEGTMCAVWRFYSMLLALSRSIGAWNTDEYSVFSGGENTAHAIHDAYNTLLAESERRGTAHVVNEVVTAAGEFDSLLNLLAEQLLYEVLACFATAITPIVASLRLVGTGRTTGNDSAETLCSLVAAMQSCMRATFLQPSTELRLTGELLSIVDALLSHHIRWRHPPPKSDPSTQKRAEDTFMYGAELFGLVLRPLCALVPRAIEKRHHREDKSWLPRLQSSASVLNALGIVQEFISARTLSQIDNVCKNIERDTVLLLHSRWYSDIAVESPSLDESGGVLPAKLQPLYACEYDALLSLWCHQTPKLHHSLFSVQNSLIDGMAQYMTPFVRSKMWHP